MDPEPAGEYITLVVQLRDSGNGSWQVQVEGAGSPRALPLLPATLVLRIWRAADSDLLRGTVRHHESDRSASFQSNSSLANLVTAWLLPDSSESLTP